MPIIETFRVYIEVGTAVEGCNIRTHTHIAFAWGNASVFSYLAHIITYFRCLFARGVLSARKVFL